METFTWDADSYPKLETAYREAEAEPKCTLVDLTVIMQGTVTKLNMPFIVNHCLCYT